jgi:hypothetical protein
VGYVEIDERDPRKQRGPGRVTLPPDPLARRTISARAYEEIM